MKPRTAPRELTLPKELERALRQERGLRKWFDALSYSRRKWLADIVAEPKSVAARERRAEHVAELIMEVMEAEEELPPMLQLALHRTPGAEEGWRKMTQMQRRAQLLAIFYYRTPQSRMRRLEKAVAEAVAVAEKKREDG